MHQLWMEQVQRMKKSSHLVNGLVFGSVTAGGLLIQGIPLTDTLLLFAGILGFALFPDADTETRRLHRRLTHNVWFIATLGLLGFITENPMAYGAMLGMATHVVCDAFGSYQRLPVLWPIYNKPFLGVKGHDPRDHTTPGTIAGGLGIFTSIPVLVVMVT